ncbi:DNA ligase [Marinobacter nauticus]
MPFPSSYSSGLPALTFILLCLFFYGLCLPAHAVQPPAVPLANRYDQNVDLRNYWLSEKLDGVRAYWDGERLWSRGGHQYQAPDWFTDPLPERPLDGELWAGRGEFARLSGIVRKTRPVDAEWRQVRFHVFDMPAGGAPFSERYRQLKALVNEAGCEHLVLVVQQPVVSHQALMSELDAIVAKGGEGLMLKRIDSLYQAGRSDDLLKVKRYQDAEARVVGHTAGQGKYAGMLGALEVELADGRALHIGTGFTDQQRRHPPPVGSTITFRYRGLTSTGLPRFASFLRIRNDEPGQAAGVTEPSPARRNGR